jgi:hypothetical protein
MRAIWFPFVDQAVDDAHRQRRIQSLAHFQARDDLFE